MDVIIVCHTELGEAIGKEVLFTKNPVGVNLGVRNLMKVAKKYGAKVSFAMTLEASEYFPKRFIKDKDCEIGLHLHPGWQLDQKTKRWYVGDSVLRKKSITKKDSTYLKDYSYDEQLKMMRIGKQYLKKKFKTNPKIFVAGRWSENNNTIKALIKLGFTHDFTATPRYSAWRHLPRICLPYHINEKANLLVVPISQGWPRGGISPEIVPSRGFKWLKACFKEYYKQSVPLFHIYLHSPSMTDKFYVEALDKFLNYISKHDVDFKFASEISEYKKNRFKTNIWPYLSAAGELVKTRGLNYFDNSFNKRVNQDPLVRKAIRKYCKDKVVLDLGCGALRYSFEAKKAGAKEVIAVDIVKPKNLVKGIKFIQADAEKIPFKDNSFDVIISIGIIEYLDLKKGTNEVKRVLKPRGIIILNTKDFRGIRHKLYFLYLHLKGEKPVYFHTYESLYRELEKNFKIIYEKTTRPKHVVFFILKK